MAPKTRAATKAAEVRDIATPLKSGTARKCKTVDAAKSGATATEVETRTPDKSAGIRKRTIKTLTEAETEPQPAMTQAQTRAPDKEAEVAAENLSAKRGKTSQAGVPKDPKQRTLCFSVLSKPPQQSEPKASGETALEEHATATKAETRTPEKGAGNRKRNIKTLAEAEAQPQPQPKALTKAETRTPETKTEVAAKIQSAKRGKKSAAVVPTDPKQGTKAAKPLQQSEPKESGETGQRALEKHAVEKQAKIISAETHPYEFSLGGSTFSCTCTRDPRIADEWVDVVVKDVNDNGCADAKVATVVGLDCEWAAPWHRAAGVPDRLATIQLYHDGTQGRRALVFRVADLEGKLPPLLKQLLADSRIAKLGVNVLGDATRVVRDFGCSVNGLFDLSGLNKASGKKVRKAVSLEDIVKEHCPEDMHISKADAVLSKGVRTSNWEAWPLSEDQVEYAAKDAALAVQAFIHRFEMSDGMHLFKAASAVLVDLEDALVPDATKQEALAVATIEKVGEDPGNKPNFFIAMRNSSLKAPNIGKKEHPQGSKDALKKVNVVVSGILDSFERKDFEQYVKDHGGSVSKSIGGKVTHLVNDHGEAGPSKMAKCKELGIPMVSEDVILQMVSASKK